MNVYIIAIILFAVSGVSAQDRILLLSSGKTVQSTVNGKSEIRVIDNVHYYNPDQEQHIYCDTTVISRDENIFQFIGHVTMKDPEKSIHSGMIIYDQTAETAFSPGRFNASFPEERRLLEASSGTYYYSDSVFVVEGDAEYQDSSYTVKGDRITYKTDDYIFIFGNVFAQESERDLTADSLKYFSETGFVIAEGSVRIIDHEKESLITGTEARYWEKADSAKITGSPQIAAADSVGADSLYVNGVAMDFFGGDSTKFFVRDSVVIKKGSMRVTSSMAEYDKVSSRLFLREDPAMFLDSIEVYGLEMDVVIEEDVITEILVRENAVAFLEADSVGTYNVKNRLAGSTMLIELKEQEIDRVTAMRNAQADYYRFVENELEGKNILIGEQIMLIFRNGELDSLKSDQSSSSYIPRRFLKDIK